MKLFKSKYESKTKKSHKKVENQWTWIITITALAFLISICFSAISEMILPNVNLLIELIVLIVFIAIGIIFDMVGIAVTIADLKTFNSMASKQVKGAKTALKLINNKSKASSFMNDVIGDICGIVSGTTGIAIAENISRSYNQNLFIVTLIMTGIISAITIGGKALEKAVAIRKANRILYIFSKMICIVYN